MLRLIDRLAVIHGMQGPFLDAGCGSGDVSLHLARSGWTGTAVDFSDVAVVESSERLREHQTVSVIHGDLLDLELSPARTVVLMDVIEHVQDDETLLRRLGDLVLPGGHLVVTVPVNPAEWRWGDSAVSCAVPVSSRAMGLRDSAGGGEAGGGGIGDGWERIVGRGCSRGILRLKRGV